MEKARQVEASHKAEVDDLIADAESYLKEHFDRDYLDHVKASCAAEKLGAKSKYEKALADLEAEHKQIALLALRLQGGQGGELHLQEPSL